VATRNGMTVPEPYFFRINKLREEMSRRKLDGYLIQDRMDQYWLTGFTGEDGAVLVTQRAVHLLTDGRFDEAADREAPYARKILRKKRSPEETAKQFRQARVIRVGFNRDHMTVGDFDALRKAAAPIKLAPTDSLIRPHRALKDAGEVERLRVAIRVAEQAFQTLRHWLRPGLTEREIAAQLAFEMQKLGAQGETFPAIVAAGPSSSLPHYEPGAARLEADQILLIDWGARVDWYGSDLTRVVWLGKLSAQLRQIFDVVRQAHDRAIEAVRPGIKAKAVDRVARDVITKAGYGKRFNHGLGHGLGIVAHESPRVAKTSTDVLQAGMVITIEPGIYLPGIGGVRIEDDVLVTETGYEVLSSLPVELS
jgi:Xaa-Pro aminopeptidase